jgi:hypothetical protein
VAVSSLLPLALGAPGIYRAPANPIRALTGVRMDVCAFVGVAPRGPARVPIGDSTRLAMPVAIESWSEYTRLFGGFEGPGRLPYAVASFFDNGGRRAYVVRIVHRYFKADGTPDDDANDAGVSRAPFSGLTASAGRAIWVRASNDGSWGQQLQARLSFTTRALALGASDFFTNRLRLPARLDLGPGTTLRLFLGGGVTVIRRIVSVVEDWNPLDGSRQQWARFDTATAVAAVTAELVEGVLTIDDGVTVETHTRVGLAPNHPRWLATVLTDESRLVLPARNPALGPADPLGTWIDSNIEVPADLRPAITAAFTTVRDRYADIVPEDFFDDRWVPGDEAPAAGIHSIIDLPDVSLLVAPDLYSPGSLAPVELIVSPSTFAGAEFAECVTPPPMAPQGPPAEDLTGLLLDPRQDLDRIAALQRRMTDLADQCESFIVLLDVPPGLSQRRMLYWRDRFDSAYAAAYHPWLNIARTDDRRDGLVPINPAAAAAGIIAQRENAVGLPFGPANVLTADAVSLDDAVTPSRHDELHQQSINVYLRERDGIRLTAGRTLARDPQWRQLNVRRLITMIRRTLERQMQWSVFEPNNHRLRFQVARMLESFLRQLYRANAFTGATEKQAFFVKCDDALNPPAVEAMGQLLAQVGVAPAEPLEFIVLDLAREGDTVLTTEDA